MIIGNVHIRKVVLVLFCLFANVSSSAGSSVCDKKTVLGGVSALVLADVLLRKNNAYVPRLIGRIKNFPVWLLGRSHLERWNGFKWYLANHPADFLLLIAALAAIALNVRINYLKSSSYLFNSSQPSGTPFRQLEASNLDAVSSSQPAVIDALDASSVSGRIEPIIKLIKKKAIDHNNKRAFSKNLLKPLVKALFTCHVDECAQAITIYRVAKFSQPSDEFKEAFGFLLDKLVATSGDISKQHVKALCDLADMVGVDNLVASDIEKFTPLLVRSLIEVIFDYNDSKERDFLYPRVAFSLLKRLLDVDSNGRLFSKENFRKLISSSYNLSSQVELAGLLDNILEKVPSPLLRDYFDSDGMVQLLHRLAEGPIALCSIVAKIYKRVCAQENADTASLQAFEDGLLKIIEDMRTASRTENDLCCLRYCALEMGKKSFFDRVATCLNDASRNLIGTD